MENVKQLMLSVDAYMSNLIDSIEASEQLLHPEGQNAAADAGQFPFHHIFRLFTFRYFRKEQQTNNNTQSKVTPSAI